MNKLITLGFAVVLAGCAHGKMGQIEQELDRTQVSKETPLFIESISATDAVVSGDKSNDTARVSDEKNTIQGTFNKKIADALRKLGYNAKSVSSPVKSGIVISGNVTRIEHGSAAARMFVGLGSGSSNMYTDFKIEDRSQSKLLSKFEIIATSGGRGGWTAAGSFMEAHLSDGAQKLAEYVSGKKK